MIIDLTSFQVERKGESGVEFSCPSCSKTEEDLDKLCLHFMRHHETLFIEIYQKFSGQSEQLVSSELCPWQSSPSNYLHQLQWQLSESLLSECGCSRDQNFACSYCSFVAHEAETLVSHYAREHHRLDLFFVESMAALVESQKIKVTGFNLTIENIRLDDFARY